MGQENTSALSPGLALSTLTFLSCYFSGAGVPYLNGLEISVIHFFPFVSFPILVGAFGGFEVKLACYWGQIKRELDR